METIIYQYFSLYMFFFIILRFQEKEILKKKLNGNTVAKFYIEN